MSGKPAEIAEGFVMDAIANDYESYLTIMDEVRTWSMEIGVELTSADVADALLKLLRSGFAQAYKLSPVSTPQPITTHDAGEELAMYYYILTPEGKRARE